MLAEVARAARELDGVTHVVLTTGTPATPDRGAAVLAECARAIRGASGLAIQAQCEPPVDFGWFERLAAAGVDSLGMHLEAVTERVRRRIMPGKAEVPVGVYLEAFAAAVRVFGRGQVSTYVLAGLGDAAEEGLVGEAQSLQVLLLEELDQLVQGPLRGAGMDLPLGLPLQQHEGEEREQLHPLTDVAQKHLHVLHEQLPAHRR